ncbi:MAG: hypothetical protein AAGA35_02745 [Patescibacteria group bacterium]
MRRVLVVLFLGVISTGIAQAQFGGLIETSLTIELSSVSPEPNQTITASINDYAIGIVPASIRWYINGQLQTSAQNERELAFTTGPIGSVTTLSVELETVNGQVVSAGRDVRPSRIDIIMEPLTFVPDFYQGAALPSKGSAIKFTAISFTGSQNEDPTNLIYTWKVNGNLIGTGGIRGRSSIVVDDIPIRVAPDVQVTVARLSGEVIGRGKMDIPLTDPEILFYPVSTLNDITPIELASPARMLGQELTVRAQPYYLSLDTLTAPNSVEWRLDNQPLSSTLGDTYEVTLSRQGFGGSSRLQIEIQDRSNFSQRASDSFVFTY